MNYNDIGYDGFLSRAPTTTQDVIEMDRAEEMFAPQSISGTLIGKNVIRADMLLVGLQTWQSDVQWDNSVVGEISWPDHNLILADGTIIPINDGSYDFTGSTDPDGKHYIYWEEGTNEYVVTEDYSEVVADNRILIASFQKNSTSDVVTISPVNNDGTIIDGSKIVTGRIQSTNGLTYWDLDQNIFIMNDGTNDILGFGDLP